MDLISALLPVYNSTDWLKKSIDSILNQTHSNIQLVIIDDGSTVDVKQLVNSFNDARIEYYRKEHSGLADSLNFGISKCKSEYIARIDADDFCVPERFEKQLKFMKENPGFGICGSNFKVINADNELIMNVEYPEDNYTISDQMERKCCVSHPTIMMRKSVINSAGGYNPRRLLIEDWELFLKLIGKTKFYNIQEYFTFVRHHSRNMTTPSPEFKKNNDEVIFNHNRYIIENSSDNSKIAKAYFNIGYHHYYQDEIKDSLKYFKKAYTLEKENIPYKRYYLTNKYLSIPVILSRKTGFYKLFGFIKKLDKKNIFFRNKF